jgi:hypothetical protein
VAILAALISFFFRRYRKRQDEKAFDSADFRRSAVLLEDPPTHQDTVNAGFNARPPPSMAEHRPPTFGTLYGATAPNYAQYQHSPITDGYQVGQVYATQPTSATSANPFFAPAPYSPNPFSPASEKAPSPTAESPITPQIITRKSSSASAGQVTTLSRQSSGKTLRNDVPSDIPANDYVDLSRSSVTPFQAAQYIEISETIGSDVPNGLSTPMVNAQLGSVDEELDAPPPPPPKKDELSPSPFSDPVHANRFSVASSNVSEADALEFPAPPAPIMTSTSRYRIDSMPPMLPEIRLDRDSRASFGASSLGMSPARYDFPTSATSSGFPTSAVSSEFATAQVINIPPKSLGNTHSAFPATPSPLASSFGAPSTPDRGSFETAPSTPRANNLASPPTDARPITVYDPEDAYGGI